MTKTTKKCIKSLITLPNTPFFVPRTIFQDQNTITNPYDSANIFTNYFSPFAETTKQKNKYSRKHLSDYLKYQFKNFVIIILYFL